MPNLPFPITAKTAEDLIQQIQRLLEDAYENRLGGARIGDVFQVGADDILAIEISSGLEKSGGALLVALSGTGGLHFVSGAISIKVKSGGGCSVDADGLAVSGENLLFFKTFTPTSGEPVVADQNSDTMTLTAGAGVSITGTAASDTITIANTDGGAAAASAHSALTTGVHGVGTGTVAKVGDIAVDVNLSSAAQAAISASHARQHAITGTSDHTSSATPGQLLKADASGLPIDASNTNTDVASAVSLKHATGGDTALGAVGTKDPPIDADKALYRDSTASDALVTSTWTQIKAFLKTYFDTLYGTLGAAHAQQHSVTSTSDHTSTATAGKMLKADANGLPVEASNTDTDVASAVSLKHAAATVSAPISLSGQALSLVNDAAVAVTEIDTGALANSDTVLPTSKAVRTYTTTQGIISFWQVLTGESITVPERAQYSIFHKFDLAGTLTLLAGAELVVHT